MSSPRWAKAWPWLAVGLAGAALAASAVLLQRLGRTQEELARRTQQLQTELAAARAQTEQAQTLAQDLQARLGVLELRVAEVSLQRSQLEELMLAVSRSRDDALVQDLEAALRLAIQQSELTGSVQPMVSALQGAQQRIERAAQPRLNPVQRAIGRDLERIRAATLVDVPALVARLDELARAVDEWPLRNDPPAARPASKPPRAAAQTTAAAQSAQPPADDAWERLRSWLQAQAQWIGQRIQHAAGELVRIRRIEHPDALLLAPEQAYFLRENARLLLLNARLAVLARQFDGARADLRVLQTHVRRYFDTEAALMQPVLRALDELLRDLRHDHLPRPEETLAALAAAAGGR
ncbi:putative uroporphyrinogen-III C-methyltransferase [Tepidimonas alkaliphilus]|uniref:Putative uroporphyrinogen-III C-methyltransferase n=1 Tax=Tepidimonas alkaliphilus TaxID=2588942 RepID=A0A554WCW9_9BURK|nr:uroporphyrinogen-III C-methyltransferase [Tepidimonas alkaliphilus]TSE21405.1 putative uroporphyrinogen-III C-methyltransferase [Tepidimonas alkaliphilus]